jgi:pimeloyl-ACP methyl ester carboxylesterase
MDLFKSVFADINNFINKTLPFRCNALKALKNVSTDYTFVESQWLFDKDDEIHFFRSKVTKALSSSPIYLCLHGTGSASVSFLPFIQELSIAGKQAIAIDLPGYGITKTSLETYDVIQKVIDELKYTDRPIHIVAHSLGCVYSCEYASIRAANIVKITWISPPGLLVFRSSLWLWLIAHGIPEHHITFSWAWPCFFLLYVYASFTQNKELFFWCSYWTSMERRYSHKKIASFVAHDDEYKWDYDLIQNLPKELLIKLCNSHSLQVIHGKWDPILCISKDTRTQCPIEIVDSFHNPLDEIDVMRNIINTPKQT